MKGFEVFIILSIIGFACANTSSGDQQYGWNHSQDRDCCNGVHCCENIICPGVPSCAYGVDRVNLVVSNHINWTTKVCIKNHQRENGGVDPTTAVLADIYADCISAIGPSNDKCLSELKKNLAVCSAPATDFNACAIPCIKSHIQCVNPC